MNRLRWLGATVALLLVGWFVVLPQVDRKALRDRCALDGGILNPAGTVCVLPR